MFDKLKAGTRVQLANGMKATVTEAGKTTFYDKPDGGKFRTREYGSEGKTVDARFNITAILNERLEASFQYNFGKGMVAAHTHVNPDGTKGGIVADTAFVDEKSRIGIGSVVFGEAAIVNSELINNASVSGNAIVENTVVDGQKLTGRQAA